MRLREMDRATAFAAAKELFKKDLPRRRVIESYLVLETSVKLALLLEAAATASLVLRECVEQEVLGLSKAGSGRPEFVCRTGGIALP